MKYIYEVTTKLKWKTRTYGNTETNEFTVIAKTAVEACEKVEKLIGPLSEKVKYHTIVLLERKSRISA